MPTTRAATVLIASVVLYFFANQTQVGWLYVMSALLVGTVLASGWLSRFVLRGISGDRKVGETAGSDLYESDEVNISLRLRKYGRLGGAQIRLSECCPLAAPESAQREINLFIPSIPAGGAVQFDYTVTVDRRGLFTFPALEAQTSAPFGFFRHRRVVDVPSPTLVYPEVRPLRRFDLLDRRTAPQITREKAGLGYEAIGVRPYQPGDSPRQIHWRSVARTGELISKEFADETQPGLTLALDVYNHPYAATDNKHTPFEWAVKIAASIGDYAARRDHPLSLLADPEVLPVPGSPVAWLGLLQYLARIQAAGSSTLAQVLSNQTTHAFVAVILPYPDESVVPVLERLRQRKVEVLAVVLDPQSFPAGGETAASLVGSLQSANIDVRPVTFGDDWATQLSETGQTRPSTE